MSGDENNLELSETVNELGDDLRDGFLDAATQIREHVYSSDPNKNNDLVLQFHMEGTPSLRKSKALLSMVNEYQKQMRELGLHWKVLKKLESGSSQIETSTVTLSLWPKIKTRDEMRAKVRDSLGTFSILETRMELERHFLGAMIEKVFGSLDLSPKP